MIDTFTPSKEDMGRAEIVLGDALPYELDMLDEATRYMQTDEFARLAQSKKNLTEWHTRNATIESFWSHARCLMEFFNRTKGKDFTSPSASAKDFTDDFHTSSEMVKLYGPGRLSETINEQISHVGFRRKAEQFEKLGASEIVRVKAIIDKEVEQFDRKLKCEFRRYWKSRQRVPLMLHLLNNVSSTMTWQDVTELCPPTGRAPAPARWLQADARCGRPLRAHVVADPQARVGFAAGRRMERR